VRFRVREEADWLEWRHPTMVPNAEEEGRILRS
jgi:hypothetical protein